MATTATDKSEAPRIAVFGAGLVGIFIGGALAPHAEVTLIGRAEKLAPLAAGLRLTDVDGRDETVDPDRLRLATGPEALAGAELVLVTVKGLATGAAGQAIGAHAPQDAVVLSFQNGVSNAGLLRAAAPGHRVLAGMVPFNVAARGPAHYHRGTAGALVAEAHPALERFLGAFAAAGLPLSLSHDIDAVLWGKLLVNLNNAVNALSGVPLAEELRQRAYRQAWALTMREGMALTRRAGIRPVDPLPMPLELMPAILSLPDRLYRFVMAQAAGGRVRVDPHARSSMADDLAEGRPTEVDLLNGEVVRLAERLGRRAPANACMVRLVRAAEAGARPMAGPELLALLRAAARGG
jgi:2-dehydropantoate 2-reductase